MINKNDVYTTEVTSYSSDGAGICRIDGMAIFVPFAVLGDIAEIKILKVLKNYAYGKILNLIVPSERRAKPQCSVFGKCGGCSLMHLNYEAQLEFKRICVQDCMRRIGGIDISALPVIGAEKEGVCRNKVQVPVKNISGKAAAGFYAPRSHEIIEYETCIIQPHQAHTVIDAVLAWMNEFKIPAYNEEKNTGAVRHIYMRTGKSGIMAVIVSAKEKLNALPQLTQRLKNLGVSTALINVNAKRTNVILGEKNIILFGSGVIYDELCGIKFAISPHSFYQVNPHQAEKLYKIAVEKAEISKNDIVFDLYCGIGTISLYAAGFAKYVYGIEIVPEAVADAKKNAENNNISNAEFYCGDAGEISKILCAEGVTADVIIIDPPRKGCLPEVLNYIAGSGVNKVIYISCNPATLARDLKFLCENGYIIKFVQPVDMFVNSVHVECVVLMSRVDK